MASTSSESARIAVYSASAGAGKTFRLAVEYGAAALARPDDPGAFRRILGLTFTNKAAHEMKDRVLRTLQKAAELDDPLTDPIANEIALLLEVDGPELRRRSAAVLSEMLHDYGSVSLGTLDQFTHRLVRTFAIELGLPSQFEVELDDDYLLDLAVYELMSDLGTDSALTQLVLDFARANLEDDKQADVFEALKAMAKHLSKEASTATASFRTIFGKRPPTCALGCGRRRPSCSSCWAVCRPSRSTAPTGMRAILKSCASPTPNFGYLEPTCASP
jgi:ATP-dependent exoDNAse (exonuclease V) beta subunit